MPDLSEIFERVKREEQEKLEADLVIPRPETTKPKIENGRMVFEKEKVSTTHS